MSAITRGQTFTTASSLIVETCCNCGVIFGLGAEYKQQRQFDHLNFYCPNGHPQQYVGKTEAEKLREQLAWEIKRGNQWRDTAAANERACRAQKAAKTRLKNRIANGVCPCCQRSFVNVQRHIAGQHPTFATPEDKS
jgi:hypothetical protein